LQGGKVKVELRVLLVGGELLVESLVESSVDLDVSVVQSRDFGSVDRVGGGMVLSLPGHLERKVHNVFNIPAEDPLHHD
jgi:hypothetical protein